METPKPGVDHIKGESVSELLMVDIGIFVHNEEGFLESLMLNLAKQNLFRDPRYHVKVHALLNGCTDNSAAIIHKFGEIAHKEFGMNLEIHDFSEGGKSRTWNRYVNDVSRAEADHLFFLDGDILLPEPNTLGGMLSLMSEDENLDIISSRPVKDTSISEKKLGAVSRLINAGGGSFTSYKTSLCGQLYLVRRNALDGIFMPIGLPVEDGFLKAMILTRLFTKPEDLSKITGQPELWHSYESIRNVGELINHQVRIIIGGAINFLIFDYLRSLEKNYSVRSDILKNISSQDDWLNELVKRELPKTPHGYIPFHFLTKRVSNIFKGQRPSIGAVSKAAVGFGFDLIVYVWASVQMLRGRGAGHW